MIEPPDSRYWLDLVPPPGAVPPPVADKPARSRAAPVALRETAAKAASENEVPAETPPPPAETIILVEMPAPKGAAVPAKTEAPADRTAAEEPAIPAETGDPEEAEAPVEMIAPAEMAAPEATEIPAETDVPAEMIITVEAEVPEEAEAPAEADVPTEMTITLETKAPAKPLARGDLLGLLRCLMDLGGALPEPALGDFMRSGERAEMERIIHTLEYSHG
jgi:hypothetical protein